MAQQPTGEFRILIATDNHMGFREKDPVVGNDSFNAFEEALQQADKIGVDFVLLGGDLFHDQRPSQKAYLRASQIFNKYVFGVQDGKRIAKDPPRPILFDTFSFKKANYLNDNLKIRLPIFSIHGNHDDPIGLDMLSTLDQVSTNHYVNYFGKVTNIEYLELKPILFTKGKTRIALYGIGHMNDERLNLAFDQGKVNFLRPEQDAESWFNILVVHQNKYKGLFLGVPKRQSLQESIIPEFIDLVIWGHEHECIPQVSKCEQTGVHFLFPGSTVPTSLIEMEAKPKHCFLLKVREQSKFKVKPIRLQTTRPLLFRQIELRDSKLNPRKTQLIENYLKEQVEEMIDEAEKTAASPEQAKMKPLVRLKIEYSQGGYSVVKSRALDAYFSERIANPHDYLQFFKTKGFAGGGSLQSRNNQSQRRRSGFDSDEEDQETKQMKRLCGISNDDVHYALKSHIVASMKKRQDLRANSPNSSAGKKKGADPQLLQRQALLKKPLEPIEPAAFMKMLDKSVSTDNYNLILQQASDLNAGRLKQMRKLILKENKTLALTGGAPGQDDVSLVSSALASFSITDRVKIISNSSLPQEEPVEQKEDSFLALTKKEAEEDEDEFDAVFNDIVEKVLETPEERSLDPSPVPYALVKEQQRLRKSKVDSNFGLAPPQKSDRTEKKKASPRSSRGSSSSNRKKKAARGTSKNESSPPKKTAKRKQSPNKTQRAAKKRSKAEMLKLHTEGDGEEEEISDFSDSPSQSSRHSGKRMKATPGRVMPAFIGRK